MGIGGSKAKLYDEERPSTRFSDVAGYEAAKREVSEVVDFLKHPEKFAGAGATGPRGVLMVGPPGTGRPCWPERSPAKPRCRSSP